LARIGLAVATTRQPRSGLILLLLRYNQKFNRYARGFLQILKEFLDEAESDAIFFAERLNTL